MPMYTWGLTPQIIQQLSIFAIEGGFSVIALADKNDLPETITAHDRIAIPLVQALHIVPLLQKRTCSPGIEILVVTPPGLAPDTYGKIIDGLQFTYIAEDALL